MKKSILCMTSMLFASAFGAFADGWFMAQTEKAEVRSISATSELVEAQFDGKYLYPPINILDGDFSNTWCEAEKNGPGIGEAITIEFAEAVSFDEIQVVNGFVTKDYYKKNNRVKSIQLTQVAGKHFQQKEYTLKDNVQDWQSIKFDLPQTAQILTLKITNIYKGSKYDDTCLDDIRLLYKGKVIPFGNIANLKKVQEENSKLMLKNNEASFKKDFLALFGNSNKLYLRNSNKDFVIISKLYDSYINYYESHSSEFMIEESGFGNIYSTAQKLIPQSWSKEHCLDRIEGADKSLLKNCEYALVGYEGYSWSRANYSLGNHRIVKTEWIDYVETNSYTIVKLDGNNVYLNGVKYTVIPADKVVDCRYYDGP